MAKKNKNNKHVNGSADVAAQKKKKISKLATTMKAKKTNSTKTLKKKASVKVASKKDGKSATQNESQEEVIEIQPTRSSSEQLVQTQVGV